MKVAVLTSSRADYGIYLPLLKKIKSDPFFDLRIIAFGTHLSTKHGYTIDRILADGFEVSERLETTPDNDSPLGIADSMGKTISAFSGLWQRLANQIDLIFCLGDRYEMFAAVSASVPFGLRIAHLHGGETTKGAIDDVFRHSITAMSNIHFASTKQHAERVAQLKGSDEGVHNVGSLSLDNLHDIALLDTEQFEKHFGLKLENPVLVTFHPETVAFQKNSFYVKELIAALNQIKGQILITMPNADTMGDLIREELILFAKNRPHVFLVESLGTQGYFSTMKHCSFLLGNSSSGIIEAASFGKYVINIGARQVGRSSGKNVLHVPITREAILDAVHKIPKLPILDKSNIYGNGNTASKIISILKTL